MIHDLIEISGQFRRQIANWIKSSVETAAKPNILIDKSSPSLDAVVKMPFRCSSIIRKGRRRDTSEWLPLNIRLVIRENNLFATSCAGGLGSQQQEIQLSNILMPLLPESPTWMATTTMMIEDGKPARYDKVS